MEISLFLSLLYPVVPELSIRYGRRTRFCRVAAFANQNISFQAEVSRFGYGLTPELRLRLSSRLRAASTRCTSVHGGHYGPRNGHHVRSCFSYLPMNLIEEGLRRLDKLHAKLCGRSVRTLAENGRLGL